MNSRRYLFIVKLKCKNPKDHKRDRAFVMDKLLKFEKGKGGKDKNYN
jgi:hypothetical protein